MKVHDPWHHGEWITEFEQSGFDESEIVVMRGGSDICPSYYSHSAIKGCYHNLKADKVEYELLQKAIATGKFLVGVCKGAQWLTIAAGGWLIQDVTGHHGMHEIETSDGKKLTVTSVHHQMCFPYDLPEEDYKLLGWTKGLSSTYLTQSNKDLHDEFYSIHRDDPDDGGYDGFFKEPEVIWYPKIRGFAIQGHPEYHSSPVETNQWLNEQISKLII